MSRPSRRGWRRNWRVPKPTLSASMPSLAMRTSSGVRPRRSWKASGKSAKRPMAGGARSSKRWSGLHGYHDVLRRIVQRAGLSVVIAAGLLLGLVVLTARPGDRTLWPVPSGAPAMEVFVVNHGYHTGIVVPRAALASLAGARDLGPLRSIAARFDAYDWLEIGWGDEEFYTQVSAIGSLPVGMVLRALLLPNNRSVLHVVGFKNHPRRAFARLDMVQINLSEAGFAHLAGRLDATFTREEGSDFPVELGPGLYGPSQVPPESRFLPRG